jgi:hypothetical protein
VVARRLLPVLTLLALGAACSNVLGFRDITDTSDDGSVGSSSGSASGTSSGATGTTSASNSASGSSSGSSGASSGGSSNGLGSTTGGTTSSSSSGSGSTSASSGTSSGPSSGGASSGSTLSACVDTSACPGQITSRVCPPQSGSGPYCCDGSTCPTAHTDIITAPAIYDCKPLSTCDETEAMCLCQANGLTSCSATICANAVCGYDGNYSCLCWGFGADNRCSMSNGALPCYCPTGGGAAGWQ